ERHRPSLKFVPLSDHIFCFSFRPLVLDRSTVVPFMQHLFVKETSRMMGFLFFGRIEARSRQRRQRCNPWIEAWETGRWRRRGCAWIEVKLPSLSKISPVFVSKNRSFSDAFCVDSSLFWPDSSHFRVPFLLDL